MAAEPRLRTASALARAGEEELAFAAQAERKGTAAGQAPANPQMH